MRATSRTASFYRSDLIETTPPEATGSGGVVVSADSVAGKALIGTSGGRENRGIPRPEARHARLAENSAPMAE